MVLGRIIVQSHKLTLWHDRSGGTNPLCWSIKPRGSALRTRIVQHHQRYKIRTSIHFHCQRTNPKSYYILQAIMKAFSTTLPIAVLALAPKVSALFQLEVEYSDLMVPVGNVNLFHAVWEVLYTQSDQYGGLSDLTYPAYTTKCGDHGADPDLSVTIQLDGQWGNVDNISGWTMRDALVQAAWKTVDELSKPTGYDVYTECWGTTWQEGIPYDNNAPCGAPNKPRCLCDIISAQCLNHSWGHQIPSKVKVQTYDNNGVLLPDNYVMTFSSSSSPAGGGCGKYGAIAEVLASFVPGVGPFFEKGIKIACRQ